MTNFNPRSFASLKEAMASGEVKSRGQLARQIVTAFRRPLLDRRAQEIEAAKAEAETPAPTPSKPTTTPKTNTKPASTTTKKQS